MYRLRHFIYLTLFFCSCNFQNSDKELIKENFDCSHGQMKSAWYQHGSDELHSDIKLLNNKFSIVVDTNHRATNFISSVENYFRERSISLDTSDLNWTDDWGKLAVQQKFKKVREEKILNRKKADSVHYLNNLGQPQVWLINNSNDTVTIQMQDGSYICTLQAKTRSGCWYSIQYWRFSSCGNSYYEKHFPPKTGNSFITTLPNEGDYNTNFRYKLLGADKFYYSNEFTGRINYCEFVEDSTIYKKNGERFHYKLDTFIHLSKIQQYKVYHMALRKLGGQS